jgi:alpha-beta hydrolase superfamily lysophospholipase
MATLGHDVSALDRPEVLRHLFHPRKDDKETLPEGAMDYFITVEDGVEIGTRFFLWEPTGPHILFFHGNGEIASDYDSIGHMYNRYGISLLVSDYRGYGRSGGKPSATSLLSDARTIFTEIRHWLEEQNRMGPLLVMGRSLGSAPAIEVVSVFYDKVAGLILESAFARTVPLLNRLGVATEALGISEADGFANFGKIKVIGKPTLIIHGPHDDIIPLNDADILLANCAARTKQLMLAVGCGHNDIVQRCGETYFQTISRFVMRLKRGSKGLEKRRWFH